MVLHQLKFCMKCHKSKTFRMIFHPTKYNQNQNLQYWLCQRNDNTVICNNNFFQFVITLHFHNKYLVSNFA